MSTQSTVDEDTQRIDMRVQSHSTGRRRSPPAAHIRTGISNMTHYSGSNSVDHSHLPSPVLGIFGLPICLCMKYRSTMKTAAPSLSWAHQSQLIEAHVS